MFGTSFWSPSRRRLAPHPSSRYSAAPKTCREAAGREARFLRMGTSPEVADPGRSNSRSRPRPRSCPGPKTLLRPRPIRSPRALRFSPRNFSTEELQKSSVLDIVAAVDTRGRLTAARTTGPIPDPPPPADSGEIPAGTAERASRRSGSGRTAPSCRPRVPWCRRFPMTPSKSRRCSSRRFRVPRPRRAAPENTGFGAMLRDAALRVDEDELGPVPDLPKAPLPPLPVDVTNGSATSRSLAGIEAAPPPFSLQGPVSTILPPSGRPMLDDPTRTGEIDRPDFLRQPACGRERTGSHGREHRRDRPKSLHAAGPAGRQHHLRNHTAFARRPHRPTGSARGS